MLAFGSKRVLIFLGEEERVSIECFVEVVEFLDNRYFFIVIVCMGSIHKTFTEIVSPRHLFQCWDEFKRGKRGKEDVQRFERYLEDNVFELHDELASQRYRHGPYHTFHIYDPKHRVISKASVRDRLVHHALWRALSAVFEPTFIFHSYASRLERGTHLAVVNVSHAMRSVSRNYTKQAYVLKCDIRKFFDSVDHQKLLALIERKISDSQLLWLLRDVVSSFSAKPSSTLSLSLSLSLNSDNFLDTGLPIGNLTSQIFANIYLNELDQFVKHTLHIHDYFRYADDFVIVHSDSNYLQDTLAAIRSFLPETLALELHPRKVEIRKFSQGIDFLGYVILPYYAVLRTKTRRRMFKKLFEADAQIRTGRLTEASFGQMVQSYLGLLKHCSGYNTSQVIRNSFHI